MISVIIPLGEHREFEAMKDLKKQKKVTKTFLEVGPNPSENRNRGIKKAKTPFVAFINGHTTLPENWSEAVISFFKKFPKADIVGGPQLSPPDEKFFGKASGYALSSLFGAAEASSRYKTREKVSFEIDERHLTSSNLICKKHVFKKVLFDESLYPGEDPKFISDSLKAGFKIAFSPNIIVYNRRRGTLFSLAKQIFNYGLTRTRKEKLRETLKKPSFLIPSLFIIYLALLPTLFMAHWIFIIPLFLYLILNIGFSLFESIRNNSSSAFFILPFIFLTIHLSYGIGFLIGVFSRR